MNNSQSQSSQSTSEHVFPVDVSYSASMRVVAPGFKRGSLGFVMIQQNSRWVLAKKHVYPDKVFRMIGGGLEPNEDPQTGSCREAQEELGILFCLQDFRPLVRWECELQDETTSELINLHLYVFGTAVPTSTTLKPSDDVDELHTFSDAEFDEFLQNLRSIPVDLKHESGFFWSEYGKLYADLHEQARDQFKRSFVS